MRIHTFSQYLKNFAWKYAKTLLLSYTQTGRHVGQNFDWVRYSKIAGFPPHWCGTEVWIWCNRARCGVQSAPYHILTNLSRTGPLISCWPQMGQHQSSGGWAEPRHFWGGSSLVVVSRMQEWKIGELQGLVCLALLLASDKVQVYRFIICQW